MSNDNHSNGNVISLFSQKIKASEVSASAERFTGLCPLCDKVTTPCGLDADNMVGFFCDDGLHARVSWREDVTARQMVAVPKTATGR